MSRQTGTGKYEQLLERCREPARRSRRPWRIPARRPRWPARSRRAQKGLITPILVGPAAKIAGDRAAGAASTSAGARSSTCRTATPRRPRRWSWCAQGKAELLMKGSLHTDELLGAVVARETGLRTGRRISHVFIMDVPDLPQGADRHRRRDQHRARRSRTRSTSARTPSTSRVSLGVEQPKVAILAAVETVTSKMPATIDAAALCKMAERGQITGALLDGPLAFDNAISKEAARDQGHRSRRWPAIPTSCSPPTSRRATSWPSSSASWPTPTAPAWCWARACRSS